MRINEVRKTETIEKNVSVFCNGRRIQNEVNSKSN